MPTPTDQPPVRRIPPPWPARTLAFALCIGGLAACHEPGRDLAPVPPPPANPTEQDNQRLIGGFAANDPRLDSIGAMVLIPPYPWAQPEHLCGASVIASETLVTAKHCAEIIPYAMSAGYKVAFAIGPDIRYPKRIVDLAAFQMAPGDYGGFVGLGRDVAVLHLEHPLPPEFKPLEIGALSDDDIGLGFAAIGYGIQDNSGQHGTRRLGRQTLKGREGRTFEHLFGTFARFLEWFTTGGVSAENLARGYPARPAGPMADAGGGDTGGGGAGGSGGRGGSTGGSGGAGGSGGSGTGGVGGSSTDGGLEGGGYPGLEEIARYYWDTTVLEKDYEVVTGGFPGDAQPCFGDSGSSLVKYKDGKYFSYGVVSGGLGTNDLICDLGTVYASFGPEVATFLDSAKNWVDPCGDMDSQGTCDGNVAKRCTNMIEGRRRVVEFDCGLVGMECNTLTGQVSCDGNVFGPPAPTRPAPPPPVIRSMVDKVFKGVRRN